MAKEVNQLFGSIIAAEGRITPEWVKTAKRLQAEVTQAVSEGTFPEDIAAVTGEVRHVITQHAPRGKASLSLTYTRRAEDVTGMLLGDREMTPLGEKETRVLEHFLTHPAHLISGQELRQVGDIAKQNALRKLINSLRTKLQDNPEQPHVLHSLRGGWMYTANPIHSPTSGVKRQK